MWAAPSDGVRRIGSLKPEEKGGNPREGRNLKQTLGKDRGSQFIGGK